MSMSHSVIGDKKRPLVVVAIGGNALIEDNDHISMDNQMLTAKRVAKHIVRMIEEGWRVVLSHGNGPHVGLILRAHEIASGQAPKLFLDHAVSQTQGSIGYLLQLALNNELSYRHLQQSVITTITQVVVDKDDISFNNPTKPIGVFMSEKEAKKYELELGWSIVEDSGRGWRRVVASPTPLRIIEADTILTLIDSGALVIACGGGGIPVIDLGDHIYQGVEAVIDKDYAAAILAIQLHADLYLVLTGVEKVAINFGKHNEKWLSQMTTDEAAQFIKQGQFPTGSMLPKIDAILTYLAQCPKGGGLITSLSAVEEAIAGKTGTKIVVA